MHIERAFLEVVGFLDQLDSVGTCPNMLVNSVIRSEAWDQSTHLLFAPPTNCTAAPLQAAAGAVSMPSSVPLAIILLAVSPAGGHFLPLAVSPAGPVLDEHGSVVRRASVVVIKHRQPVPGDAERCALRTGTTPSLRRCTSLSHGGRVWSRTG